MGADIFLFSVLEHSGPGHPGDDFEAVEVQIHNDKVWSGGSGGYYRNSYNAGDVMWAMGLSWTDTVLPMLDEHRFLPLSCARELITMIGQRLTRERLSEHFLQNFTDGADRHPIAGPLVKMLK